MVPQSEIVAPPRVAIIRDVLEDALDAGVVEYLERSGFVVRKRPAETGHTGLARGKNDQI